MSKVHICIHWLELEIRFEKIKFVIKTCQVERRRKYFFEERRDARYEVTERFQTSIGLNAC